jgi:hypothetical protein
MECMICGEYIPGSRWITDVGQLAGCLVIHLIDRHWPMVEQIRATTGKPAARMALIDQLEAELRG